MNKETVINFPKKLFKYVVAVKLINKAVRIGHKIYRMIPRFDKITGIDTDKFVMNHISK